MNDLTNPNAELEQTSPKRELRPQKLYPPPQVIKKMIERRKNKIPKNPVIRFFWVFFGEGF